MSCKYCGYSFGVSYNVCDSCQKIQDEKAYKDHVTAYHGFMIDIEIAKLKAN